jgi:hypothetical protein
MLLLTNIYKCDSTSQVAPPPGYTPMPGQPQFPGHRPMATRPPAMPIIGPNGDPIFYHPHYPQLKADICKTCRNVVPIRPLKFAKKLTAEQVYKDFLFFFIEMISFFLLYIFIKCFFIIQASL